MTYNIAFIIIKAGPEEEWGGVGQRGLGGDERNCSGVDRGHQLLAVG